MHRMFKLVVLLSTVAVAAQCTAGQNAGGLSPTLKADLTNSRGVFVVPVQTATRRAPNESWFVYQNGAIYISMARTDPRVYSIHKGDVQTDIRVGTADGPSFTATGAIIDDPEVRKSVLDNLQRKYPDLWQQLGGAVRYNLMTGGHVLIKYTPQDS